MAAEGPDEVELEEGDELEVYRLVKCADIADPALIESMKSNAALGRDPKGRELEKPRVHEGVSVFKTLEQAEQVRRAIARRLAPGREPRIGDYVARLRLRSPGVTFEDPDALSGHMTVWAEPEKLIGSVVDITEAAA